MSELRRKGAKIQYLDQYHVSAREAAQRYRARKKGEFIKVNKIE